MTAATALEIVSSSANDSAAGTGARTVLITALDATYAQITAFLVTLNGTTPVQLPNGATYFRLNQAVVASAGSTKVNEGVITIRDTGAGTTRAIIPLGYGITRQTVYTVPLGSTLEITDQVFSLVAPSVSKDCTIGVFFQTSTNVYRIPFEISVDGTPYLHPGIPGITLTEKTDFCHRVTSASGTMTLNTGILGVQRLNTAQ